MAFQQYRDSCKSSEAHEFDIERFVYDIFAYTLPICGFPDAKIPTTCREDNTYVDNDFVMNVALDVLPIALYMRDDWKPLFESKHEQNGFRHSLDIQAFLESVLQDCEEIDEDDTLSQLQYSLALYNEIFLFFNYKGIEDYFDILPKTSSQLCQKLIAQNEVFSYDFESSFNMDPDITEDRITYFIRNYAIPYGSRTDVSDMFSAYAFSWDSEGNVCPEGTSADENVNFLPDAIAQASNVSDTKLEPSVTQDSESGILPSRPESLDSSKHLQNKQEEKAILKHREAILATRYGRHTKGLAYVLQQRLKGKKRSRSQKLEIEDAFKDISFEKENVSPENHHTKRRRHASGKDKLE